MRNNLISTGIRCMAFCWVAAEMFVLVGLLPGCASYEQSLREFRANAEASKSKIESDAVGCMKKLATVCANAEVEAKSIDTDDTRLRVIKARIQSCVRALLEVHLDWIRQSQLSNLRDSELAGPYFIRGINDEVDKLRSGIDKAADRDSDELAARILLAQKRSSETMALILRDYYTRLFNPGLANEGIRDVRKDPSK